MTDIWRRKKPCEHREAVPDGNPDWPGLICKQCGEKIPESEEKHYEKGKQ